jgi:hypothetical protein
MCSSPKRFGDTGKMRSFLAYRGQFIATDPGICRPAAYPGGPLSGTKAVGGAFDGSAALNSLSDRLAPVIQGLPANFQFTEGDLIEFRESTLVRSLHTIAADVAANASGVATVGLHWPVPADITTSAVVHLEQPSCIMKVTQKNQPRGARSTSFSFEAVEVFPS